MTELSPTAKAAAAAVADEGDAADPGRPDHPVRPPALPGDLRCDTCPGGVTRAIMLGDSQYLQHGL